MSTLAESSDKPVAARPVGRRALARLFRFVARHERWLFVALIVVNLIPIWSVKYLPTTDGPAHVASADVMRRYNDPQAENFRKYYFISGAPSPNLAGHLALAGLMYVVPPGVAEKILVSLCVTLLPLGLRYAAGGIRRRASTIAFVAFPMTYSFLLAQGFYNFCLSLGVLGFVVGYWFRIREKMTPARAAGLFGLSLVLYACHLFSLLAACGVIGLTGAWEVVRGWQQRRSEGGQPRRSDEATERRREGTNQTGESLRSAMRSAIFAAVALLPAVVLAVAFRPSTNVPWLDKNAGRDEPASIRKDLTALLRMDVMISYRNAEGLIGTATAAVFGGLVLFAVIARARRGRRAGLSRWDVLLVMPLGMVAVYLRSNDPVAIHFYIPPRTMYCAFVMLALWLAAQPYPRAVRGAVPVFCAVLAVGMAASHAMKYRQFAPHFAEYVAAGEQIERGSTFLPLTFAPMGKDATGRPTSVHVAPFYMASGYIAVARGAVDLRNYEARTDHFPVRFRPEVSPFTHLTTGNGLEQIPPRVEFEKFERAGGRADYVLIWGRGPEQQAKARAEALAGELVAAMPNPVSLAALLSGEDWIKLGDAARLERDLAARYERVPLPAARWTELWRRRGLTGGTGTAGITGAPREITVLNGKAPMNDDTKYVVDAARRCVWSGFYTPARVNEIVDDILDGDVDEPTVRESITEEFKRKAAAQGSWPAKTDCDRLDAAFASLQAAGIVALHNAGYTMSEGHDDAMQAIRERRKRGLPALGYCFYHGQDVERAVDGGELWIAFDHPENDSKAKVGVGRQVVAELRRQGLRPVWDEDPETRISIPDFDWKRRGP